MSLKIDVLVTIEPDFLDVETSLKAFGKVGKGGWWQPLHVGIINGYKTSRRIAKCGGLPSCAGAVSREIYSGAIGKGQCGHVSIVAIHADASSSNVGVSADLPVGRPIVWVISQNEMWSTLVAGSTRVLPWVTLWCSARPVGDRGSVTGPGFGRMS